MCNFLPVKRENYCIGVPFKGTYEEIFTSDKKEFGGSGFSNGKAIKTSDTAMHGFEQSISLTLPENTVFFLRCRSKKGERAKKAPTAVRKTAKRQSSPKAKGAKG